MADVITTSVILNSAEPIGFLPDVTLENFGSIARQARQQVHCYYFVNRLVSQGTIYLSFTLFGYYDNDFKRANCNYYAKVSKMWYQ
jgi:hypothetical protein